MNISSILARLQANLDVPHLVEQLLLIPPLPQNLHRELTAVNLLVGYSNSDKSQAALDLTLWIALQTRLATSKSVTVQVVYVAEEVAPVSNRSRAFSASRSQKAQGGVATLPPRSSASSVDKRVEQFEQADRILWQARSLAGEWRGSLKTHLRFGDVAEELSQVAEAEDATLLIVGCQSASDALIRRFTREFHCPVLGIPDESLLSA